ncbi:hypothetical protein RIF29_35057 [Crotalaria pallida]|uniref:Uncharacterized protein n=1 Tax=Crotalaria pallida TaxID=3830 RepID=A0AAN9EA02_CROPI
MDMWKWIREATAGNLSHVFLATLWWAWRWRSSEVLGLENWHVDKVVWNISVTIEELLKWCPKTQPSAREGREISWTRPSAPASLCDDAAGRRFRRG